MNWCTRSARQKIAVGCGAVSKQDSSCYQATSQKLESQKTCFRMEKLTTALNSLKALAPCTPPAPIPGPSCCIIYGEERWHTLELKKYAGFQASWIVIRRSLNELVMAWCFAFKYFCLVIGVLLFTWMTQLVHYFQHYQLPEKLVANRNPIFKNWKGQMLPHEKIFEPPFLIKSIPTIR